MKCALQELLQCSGMSSSAPAAADLKRVVAYLQKEIRAERRNGGALKLSNLLQIDRFEEDLNISRVRLKPPVPHPKPAVQPALDPEIDEQQRDKILDELRIFRQHLGRNGSASLADALELPPHICPQPTKQRDQIPLFLRNTLTLAPRNDVARYTPFTVHRSPFNVQRSPFKRSRFASHLSRLTSHLSPLTSHLSHL
jgi:hypothetical protein